MKIDKTAPPPRVNSGDTPPRSPSRPAEQGSGTAESASNPAVVTHINKAMTDTSQDVNSARVDELKEAIRDGRLQIDPERIADKLIASAQDLLQDER